MEQLIKVQTNSKNEQLVSARDLHQFLVKDANGGQTGQDFTHWIKDKIDFGFEIGVDYTTIGYDYIGNIVEENGVAKNNNSNEKSVRVDKRDYILSIDCAIDICFSIRRNLISKNIAKYLLCEKDNNDLRITLQDNRKEIKFGNEIINNLFSEYKILAQHPVFNGEYRVDWYIPELNLAIEYDEKHHKYNVENDKIRQKRIEQELKCKFIRYSEII